MERPRARTISGRPVRLRLHAPGSRLLPSRRSGSAARRHVRRRSAAPARLHPPPRRRRGRRRRHPARRLLRADRGDPAGDADRARRRVAVPGHGQSHRGSLSAQGADRRVVPARRRRRGRRQRQRDRRPSRRSDRRPEARYASRLLFDCLEAALAALPAAQREVFVAHELEGRSFAGLAAESGTSINTLLARKRYAVLHLRESLQQHRDTSSTTIGRTP